MSLSVAASREFVAGFTTAKSHLDALASHAVNEPATITRSEVSFATAHSEAFIEQGLKLGLNTLGGTGPLVDMVRTIDSAHAGLTNAIQHGTNIHYGSTPKVMQRALPRVETVLAGAQAHLDSAIGAGLLKLD